MQNTWIIDSINDPRILHRLPTKAKGAGFYTLPTTAAIADSPIFFVYKLQKHRQNNGPCKTDHCDSCHNSTVNPLSFCCLFLHNCPIPSSKSTARGCLSCFRFLFICFLLTASFHCFFRFASVPAIKGVMKRGL